MAYSDYGAEVFCNGKRRKDKEDAKLYSISDVEWENALQKYSERYWQIFHGIMGDGNIRVTCYKQGIPIIYELNDGKISTINYIEHNIDPFEYDITYDYKGYHFEFYGNPYDKPYKAYMTEPDGTEWECYYDYWYGDQFY